MIEQKQAILAVGTEINISVELSSSQWQLMMKVLFLLKPFEEATKEAFADSSIAILIPLINAIIRQLESDEGVKSMK